MPLTATYDWFAVTHAPTIGETFNAPTDISTSVTEPIVFPTSLSYGPGGTSEIARPGATVTINGQSYTFTGRYNVFFSITTVSGPVGNVLSQIFVFQDAAMNELLMVNLGRGGGSWPDIIRLDFASVSGPFASSYAVDEFNTDGNSSVSCFAAGTMIRTPAGDIAVEDLTVGDNILTEPDTIQPIKWIGLQTVNPRISVPEHLEPVWIEEGALGKDIPDRPLVISSDHALCIDGVLVNASALVNGTSVTFLPFTKMDPDFIYYHIETEEHAILFANGARAETFCDVTGRRMFDNFFEYSELYGSETPIIELTMPRITSARLLPESLRHKLGLKPLAIPAKIEA